MIDYILFEKKPEGDNPVWDKEHAIWFCKEQDVTVLDVTEELQFIIVKTGEPEEGQSFRLLEITPTITFLLKDDPSLDEFMEVETVQNATHRYEPIEEKA
jgi:hypothetical protein